jgi:tetratricopeptide (TPR) repeat protein
MAMLSGDRAMANAQYDFAIEEYGYVLMQRPGKIDAQISLGKALLAGEYPERARDHLEAAYNIRPENDKFVELLAVSMLLQGDLQAMTDLLRDHSEQFPSVRAHLITGKLMEKAGDLDRAERSLQTAANIDGGQSVQPQLALADFHRRLGDDEAAMDRYRMALFVDPNNEAASDAIRAYGEIPGPTLAIPPAEWASAAE